MSRMDFVPKRQIIDKRFDRNQDDFGRRNNGRPRRIDQRWNNFKSHDRRF